MTTLPEAHPDLENEQKYLDGAYTCLESMIDRLDDMTPAGAHDGAAQRIREEMFDRRDQFSRILEDDGLSILFGRIDYDGDSAYPGETFYIGRASIYDQNYDEVVVDWRADVADPYHNAHLDDPCGITRKRTFDEHARVIEDLYDEVFGDEAEVPQEWKSPRDYLLEQLDRQRTGEMGDVVASIQREQNRLIRLPLDTTLAIQGGPGTGKTVVGLHRLSYLLYQHRDALSQDSVLVVGPNDAFLSYVRKVLPGLGEEAVRHVTIGKLGPRVRLRASDTDPVTAIKGDARMAQVIQRYIEGRIQHLDDDLQIGSYVLTAEEANAAIERMRGLPHMEGRQAVREAWIEAIAEKTQQRPSSIEEHVRSNPTFTNALNRAWPQLSAEQVVHDILGGRKRLGTAASGILGPAEQATLLRTTGDQLEQEPWTALDIPLLDEAEALLNGVPSKYQHIVIDEVQDLSPMQLRMIARRCPSGSMTLLGDLAQGTSTHAAKRWEDILIHLPKSREVLLEELTLGYRVPKQFIELANRLLPHLGVDVPEVDSLREVPHGPEFLETEPTDLPDTVVRTVTYLSREGGTVGVITADTRTERWRETLEAAEVDFTHAEGGDLTHPVTLVPATLAKGLEFNHVIVVEPSRIASGPNGLGTLYVALTRAIDRLVVAHSGDIPPALSGIPISEPTASEPEPERSPTHALPESPQIAQPIVPNRAPVEPLQRLAITTGSGSRWSFGIRRSMDGAAAEFQAELLPEDDGFVELEATGWMAWNETEAVVAWRTSDGMLGTETLSAPASTAPAQGLVALARNVCEAVAARLS